jgi:hypothetical protein
VLLCQRRNREKAKRIPLRLGKERRIFSISIDPTASLSLAERLETMHCWNDSYEDLQTETKLNDKQVSYALYSPRAFKHAYVRITGNSYEKILQFASFAKALAER